VIRRSCFAAATVAALALAAGGSAARDATLGPKAYFVLGQQLVGVQVVAPTRVPRWCSY
jgi:hypothetical protein